MKGIIAAFSAVLSAAAASAMPSEAGVTLVQNKNTREVTISYDLSEAAIVTFSMYTNGVKVAPNAYASATGNGLAYGRKVEAGTKTVSWRPYLDGWTAADQVPVKVKVKVWATNNPPDYIVCNLASQGDVTYYETTNDVPGGVTDYAYKTTHLVLRRIHAAGIPWEIGSPYTEVGRDAAREALHPVTLTNDFYIGIYELT